MCSSLNACIGCSGGAVVGSWPEEARSAATSNW